jgi:hypothetical protein
VKIYVAAVEVYSAFNAQGSRLIIVVVQLVAICSSSGSAQEKGKTG